MNPSCSARSNQGSSATRVAPGPVPEHRVDDRGDERDEHEIAGKRMRPATAPETSVAAVPTKPSWKRKKATGKLLSLSKRNAERADQPGLALAKSRPNPKSQKSEAASEEVREVLDRDADRVLRADEPIFERGGARLDEQNEGSEDEQRGNVDTSWIEHPVTEPIADPKLGFRATRHLAPREMRRHIARIHEETTGSCPMTPRSR